MWHRAFDHDRVIHHRRRSIPALDWFEDISGRCPRTTSMGKGGLLVENYTGILAFTPDCVQLTSAEGTLSISGTGLSLCEVRAGSLIVRGDIRQVDFPCEGGYAPDEG